MLRNTTRKCAFIFVIAFVDVLVFDFKNELNSILLVLVKVMRPAKHILIIRKLQCQVNLLVEWSMVDTKYLCSTRKCLIILSTRNINRFIAILSDVNIFEKLFLLDILRNKLLMEQNLIARKEKRAILQHFTTVRQVTIFQWFYEFFPRKSNIILPLWASTSLLLKR